jgi:hypothetical protein
MDKASITQLLNAEVSRRASEGWSVASVTDSQAILQRKKRIGWFWNIILTLITGGLWLIVVIVRLVNRKVETLSITVSDQGQLIVRQS